MKFLLSKYNIDSSIPMQKFPPIFESTKRTSTSNDLEDCNYDPSECEEIFMSELGLEMDYIIDFFV